MQSTSNFFLAGFVDLCRSVVKALTWDVEDVRRSQDRFLEEKNIQMLFLLFHEAGTLKAK